RENFALNGLPVACARARTYCENQAEALASGANDRSRPTGAMISARIKAIRLSCNLSAVFRYYKVGKFISLTLLRSTMKTPFYSILAPGLMLAVGAGSADDQPDAKVLLDKAIKAMGGDKLAKLSTASVKAKLTGSPGGQEVTVDLDGVWQGMSQYRADADVQEGGKNFKGVLVFNGDKGWIKKRDNTRDAPEGVVPFIQNIFYAGRMPQLLPAL